MISTGVFGPSHIRWLNEWQYLIARFGKECKCFQPVTCPACCASMDGIAHTDRGYATLLFDEDIATIVFDDGTSKAKVVTAIGTCPRKDTGRLHWKRRFHWRCADCGVIHQFNPVQTLPGDKIELRINPNAKVRGSVIKALAAVLVDIHRNSRDDGSDQK